MGTVCDAHFVMKQPSQGYVTSVCVCLCVCVSVCASCGMTEQSILWENMCVTARNDMHGLCIKQHKGNTVLTLPTQSKSMTPIV